MFRSQSKHQTSTNRHIDHIIVSIIMQQTLNFDLFTARSRRQTAKQIKKRIKTKMKQKFQQLHFQNRFSKRVTQIRFLKFTLFLIFQLFVF